MIIKKYLIFIIILSSVVILFSCGITPQDRRYSVIEVFSYEGYSSPIEEIVFSQNGAYFALHTGNTVELYRYNESIKLKWEKIWFYQLKQKTKNNFKGSLVFSNDTKYLLFTGYKDQTQIAFLDIDNQKITRTQKVCLNSILSIKNNISNNYLATKSYDNTIKIWSLYRDSLQFIQEIPFYIGPDSKNLNECNISLSHNGKYLLTGFGRSLKTWEKRDSLFTSMSIELTETPTCLAVSPNGNWLASGCENSFKIWKIDRDGFKKMEDIFYMRGSSNDRVNSLSFNSDGRFLAVAYNNYLKIYTQTKKYSLAEIESLKDSEEIKSTALSPSGKFIASGSTNGLVVYKLGKRSTQAVPLDSMDTELVFQDDPIQSDSLNAQLNSEQNRNSTSSSKLVILILIGVIVFILFKIIYDYAGSSVQEKKMKKDILVYTSIIFTLISIVAGIIIKLLK